MQARVIDRKKFSGDVSERNGLAFDLKFTDRACGNLVFPCGTQEGHQTLLT
jgi:hypothetical protein